MQTPFLAGDTFTLGDIDLITLLTMADRQALKLEGRFDNLKAYYERNKDRPSVVASYPPHFRTSDSPRVMADL